MKKFIIALLALLLLTACGKQEEPAAPAAPPMPEEEIQAPLVEEPAEEPEPVEIPTEIVKPEEPTGEEIPSENYPIDWEITHVEGLIEDTVAYDLEQLTFSGADGAEAMSQFYADLAAQLEKHTKENVYPQVLERHCIANVFGEVTEVNHDEEPKLAVTYEYRVEFSDSEQATVFIRTDYFDMETGECLRTETE